MASGASAVAKKRAKGKARKEKAEARAQEQEDTELIDDVRKVAGLTKDKVMVQINKHRLFEGNEPIPTRTVVRNLRAGPCKDLLTKLISYHINRSTHAAGTVQSDIHN